MIQLLGKVALGVADEPSERDMARLKSEAGAQQDVDLSAWQLQALARRFLEVVAEHSGRPFPDDPWQQLEIAIAAVFRSSGGKRAIDDRRQFRITPKLANGTAASICTMVFGNLGNDSATGVGFTRNPATGERVVYGEYLTNAQGEDVVVRIRTPTPIAAMAEKMPGPKAQLMALAAKPESHCREVQDFEFTIGRGKLWALQTRNGKMKHAGPGAHLGRDGARRAARAQAGLLRVPPAMLEQLLVPPLDPSFKGQLPATGLPASPGAASGMIVFGADTAEPRGRAGEKTVLVREQTRPEDIHGFFAAQGILTLRGGKISHAAVVARGMGKPCVSGAESIVVDVHNKTAHVGPAVHKEGQVITSGGANGAVCFGEVPTVEVEFSRDMATLLSRADEVATLGARANADATRETQRARDRGAQGIGLCRTERMLIQKKNEVLNKVKAMAEVNPMLGHRGVRLAMTYPEIYEMQIRAVIEAAAECGREGVGGAARDHVAARGHGRGAESHRRPRTARPRRGRGRLRRQGGAEVWQHDRGRARPPARGADGRDGGVLLLRHQRPDAGHFVVRARGRREQVPAPLITRRGCCAITRSRCSTSRASAN